MKKVRKYLFIFVAVQLIALLMINGLTYARYVSNSVFNYYLKSKSFYFTSDYLESNSIKNVNNFWNGESIHFNVKNSINQGAVSELDIDYTVTCNTNNSNIACNINGNSNTYTGTLSMFKSCVNNTNDGVDTSLFTESECEVNGYTYKNHPMESDLYFDLIPNNGYEINDATVKISVTSSPYKKVLTGSFIIHKAEIVTGNIDSIYENHSDYERLTITNTYLQKKCVSVNFDSSKLRINNDSSDFNSVTTENGYINSFKINMDAQSNNSFTFYETVNENFTLEDFIIKESDGC